MNGASKRHLTVGEQIFAEGDAPDVAYLIESGRIEVWRQQGGTRLTLSFLGAGEILGEMAVIDRAPRSATAEVIEDCVLTEIRPDQIRERLDEADPILRGLLVGLLARYRRGLSAAAGEQPAPQVELEPDSAPRQENRRIADKIRLERQLLDALEREELSVVFQPILDLSTGRVAGFESLTRWSHPDRGPVSPAEFIALAEETSLILPVGHYALRRSCRVLADLDREFGGDCGAWVGVNVSGRQSAVVDFVELVAAAAIEHGLSPSRLKIEITESLALNYDQVRQLIAHCRERGISVALDDFGTGYSSLGHLHRLDFDAVKVDQAFVRPLLSDAKARALTEGIVAMLLRLGADVVAEGVETVEQAAILASMGVRYLQGWWVGKPTEPARLRECLLNPPRLPGR